MEKIEIPSNSKRAIPLYFNIPDNPEYYNRKWEASLVVMEVSGNIGIEFVGQIFIETKGICRNKKCR